MTRKLDWDKPLSDEDRQWALDRGMTHQVQANDLLSKDPDDPTDDQRMVASGLRGTEPSAQSDRTEPLEPSPQQVGLHTDHAGKPLDPETGLARKTDDGASDDDGDDYDVMSKGELRDEVDKRNEDGRDEDDRIPVSGTAEDLRVRLREDDVKQA